MSDSTTYQNIFMARQPIFTENMKIWGHLLLFRDSIDATSADISDCSEATLEVLANLPLCSADDSGQEKALIHFTPEILKRGITHVLPSRSTTIILERDPFPPEGLIDTLKGLRREGFMVAVDNFDPEVKCPLDEVADMVIIDINGKDSTTLIENVARARSLSITHVMAKRVETPEAMREAKQAGFTLFHGYFFKKPKTVAGRKLTSSEITRLKLFDLIEKEEPDFDALTDAIEADVAISYRLLAFLNSASFSFSTTIKSIKQAVVLAGWRPIRNWVRLVILTDMNTTERGRELAYLCAHRAKLFETAALGAEFEDISDKLFMLGLFSLLDALLDMDMEQALAHLPIDQEIKDALSGEDNRLSPWLSLASAIENSNWDEVASVSRVLGLQPGTVAVSYQHAFTWADSFFGDSGSSETKQ
ncbi:EAL and HDOD domain-containing protein [Salidesulfovibrio brasiliensis]|uniref:EAL and HDOD domain-containing protein n=1 Tax=Salidesulfovibrio brasiliensis TaxID=221711 RepID=UPI0006D1010B|nr:HDOD domain-containing protein [Salidesulfovibrio brasiliensis]